MLSPLVNALGETPITLLHAIKAQGRRGNSTHYPTDLKRCNVILETLHDVTGKAYSVPVHEGDYELAMAKLAAFVHDEDYTVSLMALR